MDHKIEITPEMIEAGLRVLREYDNHVPLLRVSKKSFIRSILDEAINNQIGIDARSYEPVLRLVANSRKETMFG